MIDRWPAFCRVAVVGGGAAGLMAAITAAKIWHDHQADLSADSIKTNTPIPVILLEKQDRVGRKLLATGNGRCNLSNLYASADHYHSHDTRFISGALLRFPVEETLDFFRLLGLPCRTEPDGRIYPYSYQAAAVLDLLRAAAERLGVCMETSFTVQALCKESRTDSTKNAGFQLTAADGRKISAQRIILATGGLAAPAFGCDGSGYDLLVPFGHRLTEIFPALVQIRTETDFVRGLAGIKFEGKAAVQVNGQIQRQASGEILFTEYGLSGPPLLDLSRTVAGYLLEKPDGQVQIVLDLLPDMPAKELYEWLEFRRASGLTAELTDFLTGLVHKKMGHAILKRCLDRSLNHSVDSLTAVEMQKIASCLKNLSIRALGTRDWSQAQVTAGGLDVRDFRPDTLESRLIPGLYAAGEVLDVDGDCGGFNLQWAWSSGYLAGRRAMEAVMSGHLNGKKKT